MLIVFFSSIYMYLVYLIVTGFSVFPVSLLHHFFSLELATNGWQCHNVWQLDHCLSFRIKTETIRLRNTVCLFAYSGTPSVLAFSLFNKHTHSQTQLSLHPACMPFLCLPCTHTHTHTDTQHGRGHGQIKKLCKIVAAFCC